MYFKLFLFLEFILQKNIISSELLDSHHLKNVIEKFLFIGSNFTNKENKNTPKCNIYKKENISNDNSLYIYFHGNAELIDQIASPPFIELVDKDNLSYSIYEYPGYFYTKTKYKKANIENFIDYSKDIANEIIKTNKKEIYIVGWSLGVWVSLLVLNNLKKHVILKNLKVKVVLINGFYDLYQFIEDFGGINAHYGFIAFIYKKLIIEFLKKCIGKNKNMALSNFYLMKFISDISNIKYMAQESIRHYDIFYNKNDRESIKIFLNSKQNKNIDILLTSAKGDIITGKGMYKIYRGLKNIKKKYHKT